MYFFKNRLYYYYGSIIGVFTLTIINIKKIKENKTHNQLNEEVNQVSVTLEQESNGITTQKEIKLEGKGSLKVLTHV